ncbi:MAG: hypothetical protein AAF085_16425 [Planctomycetota bacterium]
MNLNPDQPDDTIDESLLNEALGEATPEELEAKILALTDPAMLSLLDEAMAPEADEQLTQRILVATRSSMQPGTVPIAEPTGDTAVLARIGPSNFRYAAAAAIALAVGLGVYFVSQGPDEADNTIAGGNETPDAPVVAQDETVPDWLTDEQYADTGDLFEDASPALDDLEDVVDGLDDVTITRDTLWAELDAYEQFLDDIES